MPSPQISKKKLKAIVFTDIADFTKLSAQDEQKALDLLQKQNEIVKPIVEKHRGEWLKEIGDGLLLSFDSSLDAVRCSIEIQDSLRDVEDLNLRIGIHQGDIFIKDGDVFGDDVNIASRVEGFAPTGGICVTDKVYNDISSSPEISSDYLGYRRLKGIENEMKLRCIYSDTIPKHKTNKMPLYIGMFLNFFGYLGVIICSINAFQYIFFDESWYFGLFWYTGNIYQIFLLSVGLICIGHTNISFVRGVSYKSQRNIVYLGYLLIVSILITIIYLALITDTPFIQVG